MPFSKVSIKNIRKVICDFNGLDNSYTIGEKKFKRCQYICDCCRGLNHEECKKLSKMLYKALK